MAHPSAHITVTLLSRGPTQTATDAPAAKPAVSSSDARSRSAPWAWLAGSMRALPPSLYLLFLASSFVYAVRDLFSNWGILFFVNEKDFSPAEAARLMALFEAGGVVGSILAGWISDRAFGGRRAPICTIFGLGFAGSVWLLSTAYSYAVGGQGKVVPAPARQGGVDAHAGKALSPPPALAPLSQASRYAIALAGGFLFGPQMLLGLCAMEIAPPAISGFATSVVSICSQVGDEMGARSDALSFSPHASELAQHFSPFSSICSWGHQQRGTQFPPSRRTTAGRPSFLWRACWASSVPWSSYLCGTQSLLSPRLGKAGRLLQRKKSEGQEAATRILLK